MRAGLVMFCSGFALHRGLLGSVPFFAFSIPLRSGGLFLLWVLASPLCTGLPMLLRRGHCFLDGIITSTSLAIVTKATLSPFVFVKKLGSGWVRLMARCTRF